MKLEILSVASVRRGKSGDVGRGKVANLKTFLDYLSSLRAPMRINRGRYKTGVGGRKWGPGEREGSFGR